MKIGIIGAGKMGAGLGQLWAKHGHHVMFSHSRSPEKLAELAAKIGSHARAGTPPEAVHFGDVLLLAVPWSGVEDALAAAGSLDGKILVSCVNPRGPSGLEVGLTTSGAEEIAKRVPGAAVVEAFNTIFASLLPSRARLYGAEAPTVFYCSDDRGARRQAAELIADADFHPVDAGPLQNARYIEPLAMLMMELGHSQNMGSDIALRFMNPTGPSESVKSADVLARAFADICAGAGNTDTNGEVLAEDFVAHLPYRRNPIRGKARFGVHLNTFRSSFSDFHCDIDEVIDDGMHVAIKWTWRGIHTGPFLGIAPTGRKVAFSEMHLLRISGSRIAEDHVSANLLDLLQQLGATQFAAA